MRQLGRLVLALLFVVLFTFTIFEYRSQDSTVPDFSRIEIVDGLPEVIIEIPKGASGSEIAKILLEKGVIKSFSAYFKIAVGDARSEKVSPGAHRITAKISAAQALEQLLDPDRIPNLVKVFEGAWKSEVLDSLVRSGFSKNEVQLAFSKVVLPIGFTDLEGLIYPAQYSFGSDVSAVQALQEMVDRFTSDSIAKKLINSESSFSPQQLLVIASIIQAEGNTKDFPLISQVIFNRLKIGMPLQMDSTVHFIKGKRGDIFLSTQSTLLRSPYNTYKKIGLPPGPIGSPGAAAMQAALSPAKGDWLYFITVAPGDTRFTASFKEFSSWKVLYTKNRKDGAFK